MKLEISDECSSIVDDLGRQYSIRIQLERILQPQSPFNRGVVIFAIDANCKSTATAHTIDLPLNLPDATMMLESWGSKEVGDVVATTRDIVGLRSNDIRIPEGLSGVLSCWMVAWLCEQGISLEKQVQPRRDVRALCLHNARRSSCGSPSAAAGTTCDTERAQECDP